MPSASTGGGALFLPLALTGPTALRATGAVPERLSYGIAGATEATPAALHNLDRIRDWQARAVAEPRLQRAHPARAHRRLTDALRAEGRAAEHRANGQLTRHFRLTDGRDRLDNVLRTISGYRRQATAEKLIVKLDASVGLDHWPLHPVNFGKYDNVRLRPNAAKPDK